MHSDKANTGVFPEGGNGSGLKVNTAGDMGKVTALHVTKAGVNANANKDKNGATYTLTRDGNAVPTAIGLMINTTGRNGVVTELKVTAAGESLNANKASSTALVQNTTAAAEKFTTNSTNGTGLTFTTTGTLGMLKTVTLATEGMTATAQTGFALAGGSNGTVAYDVITGVPTQVSIVSRGSHSSSVSTQTSIPTTGGTGQDFRLNQATFRTGVMTAMTLAAGGENAAVNAAQATTAMTGNGSGAFLNVSAITEGIPTKVSYSNRGTTATSGNHSFGPNGTQATINVTVASGIVTNITNSKMEYGSVNNNLVSAVSQVSKRGNGSNGPDVTYTVKKGELMTVAVQPDHENQDNVTAGNGQDASAVYRLTGGTLANGTDYDLNGIKIRGTGTSSFIVMEGGAAGTYTDNTVTVKVMALTNISTTAPTFDVSVTDGVVTGATLTLAGSNYNTTSGMETEYADLTNAGSGSGATFNVSGFLRLSGTSFAADGTAQAEFDVTALDATARTALTSGEYDFYQTQTVGRASSSYANTKALYTDFSIPNNRFSMYIDGNKRTSGVTGANEIVAAAGNMPGHLNANPSSPQSTTFTLASLSNDATYGCTVRTTGLKIWERTGTVLQNPADYLNVSVAKTNGNIVLSVAHKAKPVHDVSAMQVTVVVEQLDANMQTGATILESFDVFMHTLNAPFLRVTQVLGAAAGNDPAANALQYSLWGGSANYNAAKTSYATMEFEAGDVRTLRPWPRIVCS